MAYRMRSYYKRKMKSLDNIDSADSSDMSTQTQTKIKTKPCGKHRTYSEDEKQFIADPANSVEDIMAMFDYKDKATAYKMRAYFRKQLYATNTAQNQASSEVSAI